MEFQDFLKYGLGITIVLIILKGGTETLDSIKYFIINNFILVVTLFILAYLFKDKINLNI